MFKPHTKHRIAILHVSEGYWKGRCCGSHGKTTSSDSCVHIYWIFIQVLDHSIYHWFFIWNDKIDFEKRGQEWNKMTRSSLHDWNRNLATIVQWSPYASEEDLLKQVSLVFFCFFQFYHKRRDAWIVECDNSFLLWGTRYSTNWFLILVRQKS